jgi:hypothetical protein
VAVDLEAPGKLEALVDRPEVGVALLHVPVARGEVGGHEAEARVVVLEADCDGALVAGDASQAGLLGYIRPMVWIGEPVHTLREAPSTRFISAVRRDLTYTKSAVPTS